MRMLAISGSLRAASTNSALLRTAAAILARDDHRAALRVALSRLAMVRTGCADG